MNFEYYQKVLALPMKSMMKGVLRTLAYHSNPKVNNLCIPSWDTIQSESGVSRDVIGRSLRVAEELKLTSKQSRGNRYTGKEANQYYFLFEGIKFYKSKGEWKISSKEKEKFKKRLAKAIQKIKAEDLANGKPNRSAFPTKTSQIKEPNNLDIHTHKNSQKSYSRPSDTQGSMGNMISPDTRLINPDSRPEVIDTEEKQSTNITNRSTPSPLCNNKNQKTVLQEKESESFSNVMHDSNRKVVSKKDPSKQTIEEWLEDYD